MIELKNISKTFENQGETVHALKNINLTIKDREIFGIIGLSGAGKSTLVRCINLLERPTTGEVIIDGQNLTKLSEKELLKVRQSIGMIFQSFHLLEQRTLLENVCYPMEIAKLPKEQRIKKAEELLDKVGLLDRKDSYPSKLSGGQKQRVAIARALAMNPKYILCDEATSALDPATTDSILKLLKEINESLGVTIVVITHEMSVIQKICHKVAVIGHSQIAEEGLVSQVFEHPKSEEAKNLIIPRNTAGLLDYKGKKLRIVFTKGFYNSPIVAQIVQETGIAINILYADTSHIAGEIDGQMLLAYPKEEKEAKKLENWLEEKGSSLGLRWILEE